MLQGMVREFNNYNRAEGRTPPKFYAVLCAAQFLKYFPPKLFFLDTTLTTYTWRCKNLRYMHNLVSSLQLPMSLCYSNHIKMEIRKWKRKNEAITEPRKFEQFKNIP